MEIKIKTDETTARSILNIVEGYKSAHKAVKIEVEVTKPKKTKNKEVE